MVFQGGKKECSPQFCEKDNLVHPGEDRSNVEIEQHRCLLSCQNTNTMGILTDAHGICVLTNRTSYRGVQDIFG